METNQLMMCNDSKAVCPEILTKYLNCVGRSDKYWMIDQIVRGLELLFTTDTK